MITLQYRFRDSVPNVMRALASGFSVLMTKRFMASLLIMEAELKKTAARLNKTSSAGYINRKTGELAQSITRSGITTNGREMSGRVGTNRAYARLQEEGGVVTPKSAKALTIPIPGRNFGSASMLRSQGNTFVRNDIVFLRQGPEEAIPVFTLRRSVNIPASRWLSKGLANATPRVQKLFGESVDLSRRGT